MFAKLWNDDAGTVTLEYLVLLTLIGLAVIVGANAVGIALNNELTEAANAISAIDQSYSYSGFSTCAAAVPGSAAADEVDNNAAGVVPAPDAVSIDGDVCP